MVCPYSLTVPGGVQGQVFGLARALRERGHTVQIIGPADGPSPEGGVRAVGPSLLNAANGSMAPIAPDPTAQMRTIRILRDEPFDVVHLHEPLVPGPTVTALLMRSAPAVGTFHAAGDQPAYRSMSGLARWFAARLDAKVAVSEEARALAAEAIPEPWTVLFNGVELDEFRDAEPWADAEPTGRPTILFVGRHEERKGLDVLLAALEHVDLDLDVWIAGDGPQTEELRARYAHDPRLAWLGRISNEERNQRLAAASIFVAPSLGGESFGVILVEAMAAGAPVICSDINGYVGGAGPLDGEPSAARPGAGGAPVELGAALRELLADPDERRRLSDAGRHRAERFSMDRLAEAYLVIYQAITLGDSGSTFGRGAYHALRSAARSGGGRRMAQW